MTQRSHFGTDGIRGTANQPPMTADIALSVGMAAGSEFVRGDHRHRVIIGKDTRLSGYMIEPALTAGFISVGMNVILVGPMPTPAIAMLTRAMRADLGVMISASHNPYQDNGIKLFGPDGFKLSDSVEARIEARMRDRDSIRLAPPDALGRARRLEDSPGRYIEYVKASFPRGQVLNGLKIVVDCAHGAAYRVAPIILQELGADVVALGVKPDGFNINDGCGSTAPEAMCAAVVREGADLGMALDGDADRLILADETGALIDGDQLMAVLARHWKASGRLHGDAVVGTVMSNIGLERFLGSQGIALLRSPVGDRYVVETMRARGLVLGGEQSGHIVLGDTATTGDGIMAALQVLAALRDHGGPASLALRPFIPQPQVLRNIPIEGGDPLETQPVRDVLAQAEARLGAYGRLLVRKSGTEPLIRVMAEGADESLILGVVEDVLAAIRKAQEA